MRRPPVTESVAVGTERMSNAISRQALRIALDGNEQVSAELLGAGRALPGGSTLLVLAHGAGNDMHHPFLSFVCERVAAGGIATLRFNFPYKETGRKAPDPAPRLEATWRAVLQRVRTDPALGFRAVFVGGKSLGGRMALRVVAQGEAVDGLVFLGYPLHPAGKPDAPRTAHFSDLGVPSLFIQGTRDPLCDLGLLKEALPLLKAKATLCVIEGGDHSFKVPKKLGLSEGEVWERIATEIVDWIGSAGR